MCDDGRMREFRGPRRESGGGFSFRAPPVMHGTNRKRTLLAVCPSKKRTAPAESFAVRTLASLAGTSGAALAACDW
jgi:hypothetical protein